MDNRKSSRCSTCGRGLGVTGDPMSEDCGGDCWGCVGEAEARGGYPPSVAAVAGEVAAGLRDADGRAPATRGTGA